MKAEERVTYERVMNLLENYKINKSKIDLVNIPQNELGNISQQNLQVLQLEMKLLELSMNCLSLKDREILKMIFLDKLSLSKIAEKEMTCKSNIHQKKRRIVEKLAKIYAELSK